MADEPKWTQLMCPNCGTVQDVPALDGSVKVECDGCEMTYTIELEMDKVRKFGHVG